jgi:hypothetical protein
LEGAGNQFEAAHPAYSQTVAHQMKLEVVEEEEGVDLLLQ